MDSKISTLIESDEHRVILNLAALFTADFSIDWLIALTNIKPTGVLACIEEAFQAGLLKKKSLGVYYFSDPQQKAVLWSQLSPEERAKKHGEISDFLIKELPDHSIVAELIADHLLKATYNLERCRWLLKAGLNCYKNYQTEKAQECYQKAIQDLSVITGEDADGLFCEAAVQCSKLSTTSHHDTLQVLSVLDTALTKAKNLNNYRHQSLLEMHLAKNEWLSSRYEPALKHFEEGWSLAQKIGEEKLLKSAMTFRIFFLFWQGRFKEAVTTHKKFVPDVERHPRGRFPALEAATMGLCYVHTGLVTEGLGMLHTMRNLCLERGDSYHAADLGVTIGTVLVDIGRLDEAVRTVEHSMGEARWKQNDWLQLRANLILAYAYYLKDDKKRSLSCVRQFMQHGRRVQVTVQSYPYIMEICWAMEQGKFPQICGLCLEEEIEDFIQGINVFTKGVAYRYQALLQKKRNLPNDQVFQSLHFSLQFLEESGHQIELSRSLLELARLNLEVGEEAKFKDMTYRACRILSSFNETLVPDDLRSLVKDPLAGEALLKEIFCLGQELVTIRKPKDLLQHIISTVNRIAGAERGALFFWEKDRETGSSRLMLRASKNLTADQVANPDFDSSMKMIKKVARTGKGCILEMGMDLEFDPRATEIIRSRICVPMVFRDRVIGVLYHDNRLLNSAFKKSDLDLLAFFAAQAAISLDNAKAYEEIHRLNQKLLEEKRYLEEDHNQTVHFDEIIGKSPAMMKVLAQVDQVAQADANVLILGDTGVGKELIARAIHKHSSRRDGPFIRVFCNSLSETLITSELFGHEKGAFTGATERRVGRFELADGGTLFLDEIGELPLETQVRLLQVLQAKAFERVGGHETVRSDFRLVTATNRDLSRAMIDGRFRLDLYYRINVFPIHVPSLKERKDDIPALAYYFLKIYSTKRGNSFDGIPKREMDKLLQYDWPGNVRELENIIERGTILNSGPYFQIPEIGAGKPETNEERKNPSLKENERCHILWAMRKTGWKIRGKDGASELLSIHPSTLLFRMRKLGIQKPAVLSPKHEKMSHIPSEIG